MQGWAKYHRQIINWEWYTDANTFRVFFHLVLIANHKDNKWRGIDVKRGQTITSYSKLGLALDLSVQQIRTALDKLEPNEITRKTTNKYTLINIVNYSIYQDKKSEDNTHSNTQDNNQITNEQQSNNNQITTNKNEENEENEKNEDNKDNKQYKDIYDYYISMNLIKHKKYSTTISNGIKAAVKEYDIETIKACIERHKKVVELTKNKGKYKVIARGLDTFLTEKTSNKIGSPLRYEEYVEGGKKYEAHFNTANVIEDTYKTQGVIPADPIRIKRVEKW